VLLQLILHLFYFIFFFLLSKLSQCHSFILGYLQVLVLEKFLIRNVLFHCLDASLGVLKNIHKFFSFVFKDLINMRINFVLVKVFKMRISKSLSTFGRRNTLYHLLLTKF